MNFGFSDEQEQLRTEVRRFLDERCPLEQVRRVMDSPEGYSPEIWKDFAGLGLLGLLVPEEYGGSGLGWVDMVVLLEETGRSLFPSPLISTALATAAILEAGSPEQKKRWLPLLADGSLIGTLAIHEDASDWRPEAIRLEGRPDGDGVILRGEKRFVADAAGADLLVVAFRSTQGDLTLALVDPHAEGVVVENHSTIDDTKRSGRVVFEEIRVEADAIMPGSAEVVLSRLLDLGALAVTAEIVGSAEAAMHLTVRYAKEREQFGHPIGHFQGVKHPLADMYVDIESLKSLVYYAAWAAEAGSEEFSLAASRAKAYAANAFTRIGIDGIQLHGAAGYTLEFDIQLYLKRSKWARPMFGDADYHFERVASLGGY